MVGSILLDFILSADRTFTPTQNSHMIRHSILLACAFAILLSSCAVMVDNSVAPPPVAAQAGDAYFDVGLSMSPVADYSEENNMSFKPAFVLGVGSALTDFDFLYTSVQANADLFTTENRNTNASIRYYRKIFRTGGIEQYLGGHYQYIAWNDERNSTTANAAAISYLARLNAPGGTQPYLSLSYGAGTDFDFERYTHLATLAVGVQHRFESNWELRLELNQNVGDDLDYRNYQWGGGVQLQARYLF